MLENPGPHEVQHISVALQDAFPQPPEKKQPL